MVVGDLPLWRDVPSVSAPSITVEHTNAECVVRLVGEIDVAVVTDVGRMADELLSAGCPDSAPTLVIDLTEVTFLDSSGMGTLVALRSRALERGQQTMLRGLSRRVARPLEVTGLISLFTFG